MSDADTTVRTSAVRLASFERARDAWPLDPAIVHLNHGSFGAVPREVVAAQDALRREADLSPVGWFPRIAEKVEAARAATAPFVGADAADTAFVPNASAAATVVYNALQLTGDDEILVTDHGYGAVTMGAARLARRFGARLRTVPLGLVDDAETILARFAEAIGPRTRLVVVDQITSSTARRFPTAEITALAHTRGARVLVDGAHAPGLVADAAAAGGGDWWFGNLHKWPCAPRGSALFVTRASDRDDLWPLIDSWAAEDAFPARFDTQGTIDATTYLASPAAIDFIEREHGWERTRRTMTDLADAGAQIIAEAFEAYSDEPALVDQPMPVPSMRLIRLPLGIGRSREEADALRMRLFDEVGVETAFTSFAGAGYFRLSVHLYTEMTDFEAFAERCVPRILELARA
ncbi:aminotransferase class V-fold PLP-dependent enzyme [Microbacterium azadirachtae]|uniref:aminotransferase class V-fold PLP-dependent enzyme n=1 Tax=Microbacterium azadirachtae TaxID=582680 RepID=UPI0021D4C889|nr:aminotransferase class V-fold PLP-dependent enzyme [Microbacterium azadirachtae]UXW85516.1 aminotransferase class V-fold PLP-dependent enzyme [Microbacterium azadirachtae]